MKRSSNLISNLRMGMKAYMDWNQLLDDTVSNVCLPLIPGAVGSAIIMAGLALFDGDSFQGFKKSGNCMDGNLVERQR